MVFNVTFNIINILSCVPEVYNNEEGFWWCLHEVDLFNMQRNVHKRNLYSNFPLIYCYLLVKHYNYSQSKNVRSYLRY